MTITTRKPIPGKLSKGEGIVVRGTISDRSVHPRNCPGSVPDQSCQLQLPWGGGVSAPLRAPREVDPAEMTTSNSIQTLGCKLRAALGNQF